MGRNRHEGKKQRLLILRNEWGGNCKTGFPFPYKDQEDLAFGFLVGRNTHIGMQRKAKIHAIPKQTVLG